MPKPLTPRFEGKAALVTGGASGIGAATAERIAAEGGLPVIVDMDEDGAHNVAQAVGGLAFVGDATDADLLKAAVQAATGKCGGVDALITCAGHAVGGGAETIEQDVWSHLLRVHLDGALLAVKAVLPAMRAKGGGAVVLVSSMGAYQSCPGQIAYSTAKAGLLAMTRSIAIDHGPEKIRCNAICPGLVTTAMTDNSFAMLGGLVGKDLAETKQDMTRLVPLGRWAEADEIAASIAFLASEDSSYMTGAAMMVDGGATIVEPGLTLLLSKIPQAAE